MKMNAVDVFGAAHVDQMPPHKLFAVHPETLQAVNDPIDGWNEENNIIIGLSMCNAEANK